jgi:hypothetical protein
VTTTETCADERAHRGRSVPAVPGTGLCPIHLANAVQGEVRELAHAYAELDLALATRSSDNEGRSSRGVSVGISLDLAATKAREHVRVFLVGWVQVAHEEGPWRALPVDTVPAMAEWLSASERVAWIVAQPWADEIARNLAETLGEAMRAVEPNRPRRLEIGACPERVIDDEGQDEGACTGTLFALIYPADSLLPCDIRCTTDGEHRWTADQWHALGRRLNGTGHADLARRVAG